MPEPSQDKIGQQLLLSILALSAAITLTIFGVQLYLEYRRDISVLETEIEQVKRSFIPSLSESLWVVDLDQVETHLAGILRFPHIQYVEIDTESYGTRSVGESTAKETILSETLLTYEVFGEMHSLGVLRFELSKDAVYQNLWDRAAVILISQAFKTFLVSLFILYIVHRLFVRHLNALVDFIRAMNVLNLDEPFSLDRDSFPRRSNELDEVVRGFNEMRLRLFHDIQAREDAERKVLRLNLSLENTVEQRTAELRKTLDSIRSFYWYLTHELRTPVAAIRPFVRFLKLGMECDPLNENQTSHLLCIEKNVERMTRLVNQILDLAQVENPDSEPNLCALKANAIGRQTLDRLRNLFSPDVEIEMDLAEPKLIARGDPDYLETILQNYISNAARYTKSGSVSLKTEAIDGGVRISVIDSGVGVNPAKVDSIFHQFTRADGAQLAPGTGLGLYISKTMAEQMGGRVGMTSQQGKGSTFWVWLPSEE